MSDSAHLIIGAMFGYPVGLLIFMFGQKRRWW